jgi:hypothetical protein
VVDTPRLPLPPLLSSPLFVIDICKFLLQIDWLICKSGCVRSLARSGMSPASTRSQPFGVRQIVVRVVAVVLVLDLLMIGLVTVAMQDNWFVGSASEEPPGPLVHPLIQHLDEQHNFDNVDTSGNRVPVPVVTEIISRIPPELSAVFVIGMHRSSTSVLTRALVDSLNLRLGTLHFTREHFESIPVVSLSDSLLRDLNASWHNVSSIADKPSLSWPTCKPASRRLLLDMMVALPRGMPSTGPLVVKDPRLCMTLAYFVKCLPVPPHVVFVFRNPLEVAQSLNTRNNITLAHGLWLWYHYNRFALEHTRNLPRTFVSASELTQTPDQVIQQLYHAFVDQWHLTRISMPTTDDHGLAVVQQSAVHSRAPSDMASINTMVTNIMSTSESWHKYRITSRQVMEVYEELQAKKNQVDKPEVELSWYT